MSKLILLKEELVRNPVVTLGAFHFGIIQTPQISHFGILQPCAMTERFDFLAILDNYGRMALVTAVTKILMVTLAELHRLYVDRPLKIQK